MSKYLVINNRYSKLAQLIDNHALGHQPDVWQVPCSVFIIGHLLRHFPTHSITDFRDNENTTFGDCVQPESDGTLYH